MAKNNQKCVRMSDEILDIVMASSGDGFNDKFENIVVDFKKTIPEREKRLKVLDVQIADKLKDLNKIEERIRGIKNFEFSLDNIRTNILRINDTTKAIIDVSQIIKTLPVASDKNEIQKNNSKKCIS